MQLPEKCLETTWPAQSSALLREHHCFKAVVNLPFALTLQLERKFSGHFIYDPQSAGINLQSPQSDSTPCTLTLISTIDLMELMLY